MIPISADFKKFTLQFIKPMGTSRGTLYERDIYILGVQSQESNGYIGLGECAPLKGLSLDDKPDFQNKLTDICQMMNQGGLAVDRDLLEWPAIRFGLETALRDLKNGGKRCLFETKFHRGLQGLPINGLVVMSDVQDMLKQALHKIKLGYNCIKIKVGALNFTEECSLLAEIRKKFPPSHIQLRLDANGAFEVDEALEKLKLLSEFNIHSIEQPIKPGQWQAMANLCAKSPIPVALDEELIGCKNRDEKQALLLAIQPKFIVLKPTLLGGLAACEDWINLANSMNTGYWVTSALESNIGLNCISQWTSSLPIKMPQGLGTGQLFKQNFPSPLQVKNGHLIYFTPQNWPRVKNLDDLILSDIEKSWSTASP